MRLKLSRFFKVKKITISIFHSDSVGFIEKQGNVHHPTSSNLVIISTALVRSDFRIVSLAANYFTFVKYSVVVEEDVKKPNKQTKLRKCLTV